MMRQLLLVAFCILLITGLTKAQTVVHSEDFNSCAIPTGWTTNIVSGVDDWKFSIGSTDNPGNVDGTCMAWFDDDEILSSAAFSTVEVYSPFYDLTSLASASLQLDYNYRHLNSAFLVDVWDKATSSWVNLLNETTNNCGVWTCTPKPSLSESITPYLSDSVQIRLTYDDGNSWAWFMGFDNFEIVFFPPNDLGVTDVTAPTDGCFMTATENITVDVFNYGSVAADTVELSLWADGNFIATELWLPTVPIPAFSAASYTFMTTANLNAAGSHDIKASASFPMTDASTINDTFNVQVFKSLINTFPYSENFDAWSTCPTGGTAGCTDGNCPIDPMFGWVNVVGTDDDDWDVNIGTTTSGNTGPNGDHTTGTGNYLYTETSGCNNNTVIIETPCFDLSSLTIGEVSFWYHMLGATMGTMVLEIDSSGSGQWNPLWSLSGDQGAQWTEVKIPLFDYQNKVVKFRFRGQTGTSFTSDMSFDDFLIRELPAYDVSPLAILSPTSTSCSFLTTTETVKLEYINLGADTTETLTATLLLNGTPVVADVITPNVLPGVIDTHTFSLTLDLSTPDYYDLDVTITHTSVAEDDATNDALGVEILNAGVVQSYPHTETFDGFSDCDVPCTNNVCDTAFKALGWSNIGNIDDYDWSISSTAFFHGNGPTGPTSDHTSGSGKFLVVNSNACNGPADAILETGCFDLGFTTNPQVEFYYHMFGASMGTLRLQIDSSGNGIYNTLWSLGGSQSNNWERIKINLPNYVNKVVKFRIIGTIPIGFSNASNFAVDDFTVRDIASYDGTPVALAAPLDTSCSLTATETITVNVENLGADTIKDPSMTLWVNGTFIATETWTVTLLPDDIVPYTFTATADLSNPIQHTIKITNSFSNDTNGANDTTDFLVGRVPLSTYPYVQTFDGFDDCNSFCTDGTCSTAFNEPGWENLIGNGDGDDWSIGSGATTPANTGPTSDHTSGNGKYVFVEATGCNNQQLSFQTPCFDLTPLTAPSVIFWYHMLGDDQGTLTLEVDNGTGYTPIWTKSGDQGNQWLPANISLAAYAGQVVKFRMVGVSGNGFLSDFAVDDWGIQEAPAFDIEPIEIVTPLPGRCDAFTANEQVIVAVSNNGAAPATGATVSLTLNGAAVVTDVITATIPSGGVYMHTFSQTIDLTPIGNFALTVNATIGGDAFTINDIIGVGGLNDGADLISTFPYNENFDSWVNCVNNCNDGSCAGLSYIKTPGWKNSVGQDDIDWSIDNDGTPTFNTGPSEDHTSGTGQYLYTEPCFNSIAYMETPCFDFGAMYAPEVSFWYHMFGGSMGTLELQADSTGLGNWSTLWIKTGNQGNQWVKGTVNFANYAGSITKLRFKATTGPGATTDMAIDDFRIKDVVPNDLQVSSFDNLSNDCGDPSQYLTVTMYNSGFSNEFDYSLTVEMTGAVNSTITESYTVPFATETFKTVQIGPFNTSNGGVYEFKAYTTINNTADYVEGNDTLIGSITATGLSNVTGTDQSNCGANSFNLAVTGNATQYFWYDNEFGGAYINEGASYPTPVLTDTTVYWVEGRNPYFATIGKLDTVTNGAEGKYYDNFADGLKFDAEFDLKIKKLKVYPRLLPGVSNATIQVNVKDASGAILGTVSTQFWGTVGDTTLDINVDIPRGTGYTIDADGSSYLEIEMYRNGFGGGTFPYVENGTMSITGPLNNLGSRYYFFYAIEIEYLGCPSPRIPVTAFVSLNDMVVTDSFAVVSDPNTGTGTASVTLTGGSAPYTYAWSTTPVQTTETATGLSPGSYNVTITDAGNCTTVGTVTVGTVGTNDVFEIQKFNVYPNPTQGLFSIDLELDGIHDVQVEIYNSIGQVVYATTKERISNKQYQLDFVDQAAGLYQIRIRVDDKLMTKKVLVTGL